jgi:hypothetical protein
VNMIHRSEEDYALSVRLDVYLDRQPVTGRLRAQRGAEEQFVGWLGFVDALKRLHDIGVAAGSMIHAHPNRREDANDR